ncbi:MAG TPA: hypothetical protein VM367_11225 [Pseudonocardia sp.]|jgi:hypothetical protein|nr:hypothetical protein [Pseudonocardia sp.]
MTSMTRLTLLTGGTLTVLGVVAYVLTGAASITALIPTFVGVLLLVCGALARRPQMHAHAMHAALAIALLGALGSLMQVVRLGEVFAGTAERPAAVIVSTIMFVVLVAFLVLGVRSFVAARRART